MMLALSLLAMAAAAPQRIEITPELLADLPREMAVLTHHDTSLSCEGPTLDAVLAKAGLAQGDAVRGPALRTAVVARARDGYAVLFSLGEIDAKLGNTRIILADRCDAKPLPDEDGPFRLAIPGDKRGARSVRQLIALEILSID
jgi:hypothetical protein